jgi:NADH dehydrogenase (ubiquinone) 1 alpha subcomplex subunit 6
VARCLPYVLKQYNLQELTTVSELRSNLTKVFRRYENVEKPEVVNLLVYKGREELEMILMQHKQRHHLISEYVKNPALDKVEKPKTMSSFLESFLKSN